MYYAGYINNYSGKMQTWILYAHYFKMAVTMMPEMFDLTTVQLSFY